MRRRSLAAVALLAGAGLLVAPGIAGAAAPAETQRQADVAAAKTLEIEYQSQETGYYCGPAATRIALSAQLPDPSSQDTLAEQLGTTENGTDHIGLVTDVLNDNLGEARYVSRQLPDDPPTQEQKDLLWDDIVRDIDEGHALVANIVAPPGNQPPGYPDSTVYHYFTIVGYDAGTRNVVIADPAAGTGGFEETPEQYELSFDQVASLIPPKGYSA
ncbi:MAG: lysis protein [Pseudonocardiaceae bacterium]|nr:lysis protein [Pseudonocardiaceae bacterium]